MLFCKDLIMAKDRPPHNYAAHDCIFSYVALLLLPVSVCLLTQPKPPSLDSAKAIGLERAGRYPRCKINHTQHMFVDVKEKEKIHPRTAL